MTVRFHFTYDLITHVESVKSVKEKDVDKAEKPVKFMPAYFFFSNEQIPKLKAEKGLTHREAMQTTGALWRELDEKGRAKYNALQEADKKR